MHTFLKLPKKHELRIHRNYLDILIETAEQFNISKKFFINSCQIPKSFLDETKKSEYLGFLEWVEIISKLIDIVPNSGIGYKFGINCKVTSHDVLGFAMISNSNLRNVLIDLKKYSSMRLNKMEIKLLKDQDKAYITLSPLYHLSTNINIEKRALIDRFLMESALVSIARNLQSITDFEINGLNIDVEWTESKYHKLFERKLPKFNFNKPNNQISFNIKCLELPLKFGHENAYQIALKILEEEKILSKEKGQQTTLLVSKKLIFVPYKGFPTLDEIAETLNIAPRTLKRKLESEDSSYTSIVQNKKLAIAKKLISSNRNLKEISEILGYSNASSFTRAFLAWTGKNPSAFIKEIKQY